jgi:hypothetical protein
MVRALPRYNAASTTCPWALKKGVRCTWACLGGAQQGPRPLYRRRSHRIEFLPLKTLLNAATMLLKS